MLQALHRLRSLRVFDIMNRNVVEVAPDQTLGQAADLFGSRDVSSAPVIDRTRQCVGILSAVDFLKRPIDIKSALVSDVMSKNVRSVSGHEPLLKAAQIMCAKHVHRLPVTGEGHHVIGVVSTMDIVAAVLNALDEAEAAEYQSADF
jgi:CBS domain-containing membrane protein